MQMNSIPIKLYFNDGEAYVWNAQDWLRLRSEYRIVGHLRGTVASLPRQESILGLPLALLPEEASLLVRKGISKLVMRKDLDKQPTEEEQQIFQELREKLYQEQVVLYQDLRKAEIENTVEKIIEGKKKKHTNSGETNEQFNKELEIQKQIDKIKPVERQHTLVEIFSEHPLETEEIEVPLDQLDNYCPLKEKVFEDLWNKGNYVTGGEKFGGDFLLYPGDPMVFHSSHIISVISSLNSKFNMTDIVINGRLAVNVKKIAVFATEDLKGNIIYQSLSWKGI